MSLPANVSFTLDEFIDKIPAHMQPHVTKELREEIARMIGDDDVGDVYEEGLRVHTDLMTKYGTNPERYVRAVKFVSYLHIGKKTYEAFALSHPDKYKEYKQQATDEGWDLTKLRNKLSLKGANFKKTQIVTELLARSTMQLGLMFADYRLGAVEKLADLVDNAQSERVQMESADKLLTHLNVDKTEFKASADIEETKTNVINTLANALDKMVGIHQREKEINPNKSNSEVLDGIVLSATTKG